MLRLQHVILLGIFRFRSIRYSGVYQNEFPTQLIRTGMKSLEVSMCFLLLPSPKVALSTYAS